MPKELEGLPPWATVIFMVTVGVIYAVRWLGISHGHATGPKESSGMQSQVAAVIVDSTHLIKATEAVVKLTDSIDRHREEIRELSDEMKRKSK